MVLQNKSILLISPELWDHIFVSKHHYAIHLGKRGNKVFFLNPPSKSESIVETEYENVFSIAYRGFPKGLRFYPSFLQKCFIRRKFDELQKRCGVAFDVVWSFDNSVFFDFSALPKSILKICHIVDLNQNFQTQKAALTADICFCTTELIRDRLLSYNTKVFKINHGFNKSSVATKVVSLPGRSTIKVLYAGNLAMPYLDWKLIHILVKDNPDIDFIFVGPDKDDTENYSKQIVKRARNAFFIGRVKSNDLLDYYEAADILIVVYRDRYHADQANPHKMMEYLGSGKMIVATLTAEYDELKNRHLILMSEKNADLPAKFSTALKDLKYWNDEEKKQIRKKWAFDNTYDMQLERIENYLQDIEKFN